MASCKGSSKLLLMLTNGAVALLAMVIIGYAIVLLSEFGDLREGLLTFPILGPIAFGCVLLVISLVGLWGAKFGNRVLLCVYLVILFLVTVVVLASGLALLSFGGYLADIEAGQNLQGEAEKEIIDFQLAIYDTCCAKAGEGAAPVLCSAPGAPSVCISDESGYEEYLEYVDAEVCEALESVEINDIPIVGSNSTGACGGGDPEAFVTAISDYLNENLVTVGTVNLVVAILLLLLLVATCALIYYGKEPAGEKQGSTTEIEAKKGEYTTGAPLVG